MRTIYRIGQDSELPDEEKPPSEYTDLEEEGEYNLADAWEDLKTLYEIIKGVRHGVRWIYGSLSDEQGWEVVRMLYPSILGRPGDSEGLNYHKNSMTRTYVPGFVARPESPDKVKDNFKNSAERKRLERDKIIKLGHVFAYELGDSAARRRAGYWPNPRERPAGAPGEEPTMPPGIPATFVVPPGAVLCVLDSGVARFPKGAAVTTGPPEPAGTRLWWGACPIGTHQVAASGEGFVPDEDEDNGFIPPILTETKIAGIPILYLIVGGAAAYFIFRER